MGARTIMARDPAFRRKTRVEGGDGALWGAFRSAMASGDLVLALRLAHLLKQPGAREAALLQWQEDPSLLAPGCPPREWYRLLWGYKWHGDPAVEHGTAVWWHLTDLLLRSEPFLPEHLKECAALLGEAANSHSPWGGGYDTGSRGLPLLRLRWAPANLPLLVDAVCLRDHIEQRDPHPRGAASIKREGALPMRWRFWIHVMKQENDEHSLWALARSRGPRRPDYQSWGPWHPGYPGAGLADLLARQRLPKPWDVGT